VGRGKQQSLLPLSVVGNTLFDSQAMAAELAPYTGRDREPPAGNSFNHFWISLYFKYLPLESILNASLKPAAVLVEQKRQARILVCNQVAEHLGIRPGLPVKAALAMVPELAIAPRDIRLETQVLQRLAAWATRFTPAVSIDSSAVLLLDVCASLKFFGGLPQLWELLISDLDRWGYRVIVACAPTALASTWLARTGEHGGRAVPQYSRGRLAALPIACLRWPENIERMLKEMGVGTLGECIRLPRDGLARRIGPEKLRELDQGFGMQPESREFYRPPKRFHAELELPAETANCQLLLESLGRLLGSLKIFLLANQNAVQVLWIHLHHYDKPSTLLRIGLLQPVMNTDYLLDLARIRFTDTRFSAPVVSMALQTDPVTIQTALRQDLFDCSTDHNAGVVALLEQLQARLGSQAVYGIRLVPEHRPESAWKAVWLCDEDSRAVSGRMSGKSACDGVGYRPLWMLAEPQALPMVSGRPVFRGELNLEDNPERIETGWWDGRDIRRDYYRAWNPHGMRLWVFQDCRESRWYLHGLFG
jgi:protein ImuB